MLINLTSFFWKKTNLKICLLGTPPLTDNGTQAVYLQGGVERAVNFGHILLKTESTLFHYSHHHSSHTIISKALMVFTKKCTVPSRQFWVHLWLYIISSILLHSDVYGKIIENLAVLRVLLKQHPDSLAHLFHTCVCCLQRCVPIDDIRGESSRATTHYH